MRRIEIPRSALQVLLYLAVHPDQAVLRAQVMDALWPDTPPAKAASRLTSALWRLRKALGQTGRDDLVSAGSDGALTLALGDALHVDIHDMRRRTQAFLDDDTLNDLPAPLAADAGPEEPFLGWYDPWALRERVRLELLFERCARAQLDRLCAADAFEPAVRAGERLLRRDPLLEDVHEQLIRLYLRHGRPGMAKRQYDRCKALLAEELGVAPGASMTASLDDAGLAAPAAPAEAVAEDAAKTAPRAARSTTAQAAAPDVRMAYRLLRKSCRDLQRVTDMLVIRS